MSPWLAKAVILVSTVLLLGIPAAIHHGTRWARVVKRRRTPIERVLLAVVGLGSLSVVIWIVSPAFRFAEYSLHPVPFAAGALCIALGLWMLYRSHSDLGSYWSVTLEIRERHQLVTRGVYRRIRHPMYLALLLYAAGQALVVPNWAAGMPYLITLALLFLSRIRSEEQMMLEEFGRDYQVYAARTKRLIPGVW